MRGASSSVTADASLGTPGGGCCRFKALDNYVGNESRNRLAASKAHDMGCSIWRQSFQHIRALFAIIAFGPRSLPNV